MHDSANVYAEHETVVFFTVAALSGIVGLLLRTICPLDLDNLGYREGAAIVTFAWIAFSLVGGLPFWLCGLTSYTDAFFETISGFSTAGSSIFPNVEIIPAGLQMWRCETQWLGGMGIVVLSVAIMPMLGSGAYRMFKAEAPGGSTFERNAPRIKDTATVLWYIYLFFSLAEAILLKFVGMTWYEAICHAFTTMSTGGFSTSAQSLGGFGPAVQWVVIVFMVFAGLNFDSYQAIIEKRYRDVFKPAEVKLYLFLTFAATAVIFFVLPRETSIEEQVRVAIFQVASISTTTGFGSADFNTWPDILRLMLFLLMFFGGCSGSTSGGMKLYRFIIFLKSSLVELKRVINPKAVYVVKLGKRSLKPEQVSNVTHFILLWLLIFATVTVCLTAMGMDFLSASTATVANLGNIGPGLGTVGPASNYAHVPTAGKWLLSISMLLGRLEIYSVLSLCLKRMWVK